MAAALQQYQACLNIMMRLRVEDLALLKNDFEKKASDGLSLIDFISVMLDRVSGWDSTSAPIFIQDLVELFLQVDVNGDGNMTWEEFTNAIIEGSMGASENTPDWADLQYEEDSIFRDYAVNRPPKEIIYLSAFRRVILFDDSRPVVEILDPMPLIPSDRRLNKSKKAAQKNAHLDEEEDTVLEATFLPTLPVICKFHPLHYQAGYRHDQDEVRSERSPVQAVKYLSGVELLAVSAGDLKLTFWPASIIISGSTSAVNLTSPLVILHTHRSQRVLEWNESTNTLFAISSERDIIVYTVYYHPATDLKAANCEVKLTRTLSKHIDLVQDLLVLNPGIMVSCGMDSRIYLWDTSTLEVCGERQGHRRGVRLITKLSDCAFLSAGFECEILGWDISSVATSPIFKLWGHNAPVRAIELIPTSTYLSTLPSTRTVVPGSEGPASTTSAVPMLADQAISVDDDGWLKWWDLNGVFSMESNGLEETNRRCLQTFRLGNSKTPWKAHSLAVMHDGQCILAAGHHKVKLLRRVRLRPLTLPSAVIKYNATSITFLTTTHREICVWDAASANLLRTFHGVVTSDITCVDLDNRQRKIIIGTQDGSLVTLNYLNGAVLKHWVPHKSHVSALHYCKEDQCVLTVAWDRSLRLYDDNTTSHSNALLRCVVNAHETDIKCLSYCYSMALVVTGSADGWIKIWDYLYFLLEDTCFMPMSKTSTPADAGVTCLEFIEPYPLFLSGHENGTICCWKIVPGKQVELLLSWDPCDVPNAPLLSEDPSVPVEQNKEEAANLIDDDRSLYEKLVQSNQPRPTQHVENWKDGGICGCRVHYDESKGEVVTEEIRKGAFFLVLSNTRGQLSVTDISQLITNSYVHALHDGNQTNVHQLGSYNPRRRFLRQGRSMQRLRSRLAHRTNLNPLPQTSLSPEDLTCVAIWQAHQGSIRYIEVVEEPTTILSCGNDTACRVWGFDGKPLGDLKDESRTDNDDMASSKAQKSWSFHVNVDSAAATKREQAEKIWNSLKEEKLKKLTSMRQLALLTRKQERSQSIRCLLQSQSLPVFRPISEASAPKVDSDEKSTSQAQHQVSTPALENRSILARVDSGSARVFGQLKGEQTWKQNRDPSARQAASELLYENFHARMKSLLGVDMMNEKREHNQANNKHPESISPHAMSNGVSSDADIIASLRDDGLDNGHNASAHFPDMREIENQLVSFEDKDNWNMGSLNREKLMYKNFHQENLKKSQKSSLMNARKTKSCQDLLRPSVLPVIDLEPSEFLLSKLGKSCIIKESSTTCLQKPMPCRRRRKVKRAVSSKQLPPLHSSTTVNNNDDIEEVLSRDPTSLTRKYAQYQKLLGDDRSKDRRHGVYNPSELSQLKVKSRDREKAAEDRNKGSQDSSKLASAAGEREKVVEGDVHKKTRAMKLNAKETLREKKLRIHQDTSLFKRERFGRYKRQDIVNVYQTFRGIDKDDSGSVTLSEIRDCPDLFKGSYMQDNAESMFGSVDEDGSGQIDLAELCSVIFSESSPTDMRDILSFCHLLKKIDRVESTKSRKQDVNLEQLKELKELFSLYDTDGNGDIDAEELYNALAYNSKFYDKQKSAAVTKEDIARIISRFDENENATLDFDEFIQLFVDEE